MIKNKIKKIITCLAIGTILITGISTVTKASTIYTTIAEKHSITESITLVTDTKYNEQTKQYTNFCKTEDDEIYSFYGDTNLKGTWQVLIIDTKATSNLNDDIVINTYNLDDYIFED